MKPITPEPRIGAQAVVIAENQAPYIPLPANVVDSYVETKWSLSFTERLRALLFGSIYVWVYRPFNRPLQPIKLSVRRDDEIEKV